MSITPQLITKAESALGNGDIAGARAAVDQASRADAASTEVKVMMARVMVAEGDLEGGERVLRAVLAQDGRAWAAAGYLGALLVGLKRHDEAKPLLEAAILNGTAAPAVKLAWGRVLAMGGQLQKAVLFFEQAAAEAPRVAAAHHFLGVALGDLGQYERAAQSFQQAVRLDPQDLPSWQALIRLTLGADRDAGLRLLAEAERHNGGSMAMARTKTEILLEAGLADEAAKALASIPDAQKDGEDLVVEAWIHMQGQRWAQAVTAARAAVAKEPGYWRARYTLGVALESQQPLPRADVEAAYRAAIELGDPRGEAGTRLGFLLLEEADGRPPRTGEAIEVLEAARGRNGDAPGTLLNLAIAHRQQGSADRVRALAERILSMADASPSIREQAQRLTRGL